MPENPTLLDEDIYAINRVMLDYCWALDHRDWSRLLACFVENVVFEASNMGRYQDAKSLLTAFQTRTIRTPVRRHMITNPYVKVDGDRAEFTSGMQNVRVRPLALGGDFFIAGGRYRNSLVRTPAGWKIAHIRWEATYLEGNQRLDAKLPPMSYTPVLPGAKDVPWGGAGAHGADGPRSRSQQVKDLVIGLFRAIDAGDTEDAVGAFAPDAEGVLGGETAAGGSAICAKLAAGTGDWATHDFWNERFAACRGEGLYCAYVYKTAGSARNAPTVHSGGVLLTRTVETAAGWRVASLEYIAFWERGKQILRDPVKALPDYQRIARFPWSLDDRREPLRDEEEVMALLSKYTWSYDFWNFDAVAECFAEDVQGQFTTGSTSVFLDRDTMIPGIRKGRETQPYMQHYTTNHVVDIGLDGTSAEIRSYASTRRTEAGGGDVLVAGGRYEGYAVKRDGRWLFLVFQYTRVHGAYDGTQPAIAAAA